MLINQPLDGKWEFAPAKFGALRAPASGWRRASVPGNVHTDLMAAGKLKDPFVARNEESVAWVEQKDWWYRRGFVVGKELLDCAKVFLVAEGLDTVAELFLNGRKIGNAANMHYSHRWEIGAYLRRGKNTLAVKLASPVLEAERLQRKNGRWPGVNFDPANWLRKALYAFGWDWGPRLATSGIFKPIYLEGLDGDAIRSVFVRTVKAGAVKAEGTVEVEIESSRARSAKLNLHLGEWNVQKTVKLKKGTQRFRYPFKLAKPKLWWPLGFGLPHLYEVEALLDSGERLRRQVGIRTLELDTRPDREGARFALKVNGTAVFCKGANWIPADNFLGRVTKERVEKLVGMAAEHQCNMLRVWGGGTYESEEFYDACDRLGVLVWQDFAFGCNEVPETPAYEKMVVLEAEAAVRRLRCHPSLALWCGNNENYMARRDRWFKERHRERWGRKYYEQTLPAVVRRLDPTTPYWRGSPYGGSNPNSQTHGDRHNWDVWHGVGNYLEYLKDRSRFVSEFGFAALPNARTLLNTVEPDERWLQSKTLQAHDKTVAGYRRIVGHLADHLPLGGVLDLDTSRYLSQVNQSEALSTGIEHWRRLAPHSMGALFWQWNDCWPVTSWAVVDGEDRLRLAAYAIRRSFAPVLLSGIVEGGDELWSVPGTFPHLDSDGNCQFWLHADGHDVIRGTLTIERWSMTGRRKKVVSKAVKVDPGKGTLLWRSKASTAGIRNAADEYLVATLKHQQGVERTLLFMDRPRRLALKPARPAVRVAKGDGFQTLTIQSKVLVKSLELSASIDGDFSDNGFDLLPGEKKTVRFTPRGRGELSPKGVGIRSLNALVPKA